MKINEQWLRKWVNPNLSAQKLAEKLTMAGLEVDSLNPVAPLIPSIIVAQVIKTAAHPEADRLTLCEVETGSATPLSIVCGAANVRPGLKVALAMIGAQFPNGLVIKEAKLRGQLSQGMLCSASELGLAESSEGILELDADAPIGMSFNEYYFLDDRVFDIDLTPNRADCLSVVGIAREISALTNTPLSSHPIKPAIPTIDTQKLIHLIASEACPYYCGRVIHQVNNQALTPLWMREYLRRSGVRSIHPVVDVTNFVMLELGQPLHAFDYRQLEGDVFVRFAKNGEILRLLDGQEIQLNEKMLVIADSVKPLALAGVMGGVDSAVQEQSQSIFLESAFFSPQFIAGVARQVGLVTDASQRFERGVDPALAIHAIEYATTLLLDIVGGMAGPISIAHAPHFSTEESIIEFDPNKVKQLIGIEIPLETMEQMLQSLGLTVCSKATIWKVNAPSYRFDLKLDVDLVEEIIRLYGYDKLPGGPMIAEVKLSQKNPQETLDARLIQFFSGRGYHETISYSFVDPQLQSVLFPEVASLQLMNPISSELSQMRLSLWPGLIASMLHNVNRQQQSIKCFELGVTFALQEKKIIETPFVAGLMSGDCGALNWCESTRKFDFYDAKGDLSALFSGLNFQAMRFVAAPHPVLHPGKSACIQKKGKDIGWCGVLHPRFTEALGIQDEVIVFELNTNYLLDSETSKFHGISKYPQIRRDLSLLVDASIPSADISQLIYETIDSALLKDFCLFDVYEGDTIPKGKKSIALAIILQDKKRTLVDSEINSIMDAIIKSLAENYAITLRD